MGDNKRHALLALGSGTALLWLSVTLGSAQGSYHAISWAHTLYTLLYIVFHTFLCMTSIFGLQLLYAATTSIDTSSDNFIE